jgi:aspartate kinase
VAPVGTGLVARSRPRDARPRPAGVVGHRGGPVPRVTSGSVKRVTLVVQKFGGTSVGDADRIRAVADHVARSRRQGDGVVVVVSAMGKTTDDLIRLANDVSRIQPPRELDMLLTSGERVSMALLVMALADLDIDAVSFTGSQAGIITDTTHTKATIIEVRADRLREALKAGRVPVVAGFQGVSTERDVTTLGRGGSDTTAVAMAAALGADACEIYTDVSGVFSADPRLVPEARRLPRVSFEEMLEIAASGGRVLSLRSVEFARNHHVPLHVRSSFTWEPGTWVVEEDVSMEQPVVTAITHDTSEAKVTVTGVPDRPGIAAPIFRALADRKVNVDTIVQNTSLHGTTDISFTVPKVDLDTSLQTVGSLAPEIGAGEVLADDGIAKVSLVGAGMRSHPGVSATMFETLADAGINIEMISTSSIRISCVVRADRVEEAVGILHAAFELSD